MSDYQLNACSKSKLCIAWMAQSWCRILYKCHFLSLPVMLYWLCQWNGHSQTAGLSQPGGREPQRAELIREEPKARCWFLPLSGCSTCRCATSAWVMAGLWKPSAAKTLMCFRWRAGPACGWIFVLLLVVKMYVNPQVTGLSNKSSDGVPAFPRVLMSFSWNCSDGSINLVERDKTNLWFCCDFCKCGLTPLSPPPMQISMIMSTGSNLQVGDWVWQAEEEVDVMDSANFNETNLSDGLTFWNSPCEWQQWQQSPLPKPSREGPWNDGGN